MHIPIWYYANQCYVIVAILDFWSMQKWQITEEPSNDYMYSLVSIKLVGPEIKIIITT
jgi:hypothetical protein